jgi:uncharacterized membrane protein
MNRGIAAALLVAGLLYPFAVYFGIEHLSPRLFATLLGALWLARALTSARRPGNRLLAAAALAFCALLWLLDSPALLRWYPVLINLILLGLFGLSLKFGPPVIERLARLTDPQLPPSGVRYTRQVTWVWAAFFLFNATLATALTLWAPLSWWTLYNGLIAYLLMGLLFAGEWCVRQRVRGSV